MREDHEKAMRESHHLIGDSQDEEVDKIQNELISRATADLTPKHARICAPPAEVRRSCERRRHLHTLHLALDDGDGGLKLQVTYIRVRILL